VGPRGEKTDDFGHSLHDLHDPSQFFWDLLGGDLIWLSNFEPYTCGAGVAFDSTLSGDTSPRHHHRLWNISWFCWCWTWFRPKLLETI
jgi:hypothetical protein